MKETKPFLCDGTRFKLSFDSKGNTDSFKGYEVKLHGAWVALVPAENDSHMPIVKAVNCHADLLEACKSAAIALKWFSDFFEAGTAGRDLSVRQVAKLQAAIALAESQS